MITGPPEAEAIAIELWAVEERYRVADYPLSAARDWDDLRYEVRRRKVQVVSDLISRRVFLAAREPGIPEQKNPRVD